VSRAAGYVERLHVPLWAYLLPLVFAVPLLLTEVVGAGAGGVLTDGGRRAAVILGGLVLLGGELLAAGVGRARLTVSDGVLAAGGRTLPASQVAGVTTLSREGVRSALGPHGDPAAYRVTRPWVATGVYVTSRAGEGWLLSTRHPELLADALTRARGGHGG